MQWCSSACQRHLQKNYREHKHTYNRYRSGADCDGQVLVYQDMLAMYANMKPKFVKQFAQVGKEMNEAFTAYKKAVEEGSFPGEEHTFKMDETIIDKLY